MKLDETIFWFESIFGRVIAEEGWHIVGLESSSDIDGYFYNFYKISNITPTNNRRLRKTVCLNGIITLENARKFATEYGFTLNFNGEIIDFDINKITRNKHLLIGSELGLL